MTDKEKLKIESYQHFIRSHTKYSRNPDFNMNRHGFHCLNHHDLQIFEGNKTEKSRDAVAQFVEAYGARYNHYVYYRTVEAWGLPYIFIWGKLINAEKLNQGG